MDDPGYRPSYSYFLSSPFLFSLLSNPPTSQEYKIAERVRERERGSGRKGFRSEIGHGEEEGGMEKETDVCLKNLGECVRHEGTLF